MSDGGIRKREEMKKTKGPRIFYTAIILTLSIILFYLPAILFQMEHTSGRCRRDCLGIIMATLYSATFLLNYLWLVPKLLSRRLNLTCYLLLNLGLVVSSMFLISYWVDCQFGLPMPGKDLQGGESEAWRKIMRYASFSLRDGIMTILAAALGYAIRVGREKEDLLNRKLKLKAESRQIELQSLKAQLNPHFLFNSINSIYALIDIAPGRAQEALHTLSRMLRFMIYDSSDSVPLEKEGAFIEEYVELMRLRVADNCRLELHLPSAIPSDLRIAPLLYVTLVENAFKHSSSNGQDYFISISLSLTTRKKEREHRVIFRVDNSYSGRSDDEVEQSGKVSVGLANIKSQLDLLYPGDYLFEITEEDGIYSAMIDISTDALKEKHRAES